MKPTPEFDQANIDRFNKLTVQSTQRTYGEAKPCIDWDGATSNGYPVFTFKGHGNLQATRCAWKIANGEDAESRITQSCKNKLCVEPSHLTLGANEADIDFMGRVVDKPLQASSNIGIEEWKEIRTRLATETNAQIAKDYNVRPYTIQQIRTGKTVWDGWAW